ncbi:MAG: hypothetical protein IPK16_17670 [Anaerolineales bacterium]|nr:hypothetical protein [Anaerolineales bacterium]
MAWHQERPEHDTSVRARIGEETYQQLLAAAGMPNLIMTPEEQRFFAAHQLDHLLDPTTARPIKDGYGLVGLEILSRHHESTVDFAVHWDAVAHWIGRRLMQAPDAELAWLVRCVYYFVENSPVEAAQVLLAHLCLESQIHPDWLALLPYFLTRLPQLVPDLHLEKVDTQSSAHWNGLLFESAGSVLPLRNMRDNLADLLTGAINIPDQRKRACIGC